MKYRSTNIYRAFGKYSDPLTFSTFLLRWSLIIKWIIAFFSPSSIYKQNLIMTKSKQDFRNVFHLRMTEATVFLGTFNSAGMFWYPSPDLCLDTILYLSSTDNSFNLRAWFLLWHALSTVGPYIDRCGLFQIMSSQLIWPQVDSNQVVETSEGWSMETGCTWAQFRAT
jgi:hypothetical protein